MQGIYLGIFIGLLSIGQTAAAVLFSDNFNYPDGALATVAEGKWKTHSGTAGQMEVVSGALRLSQKRSEDVSAVLNATPIGATNYPALYAAFTVNFSVLPSGSLGGYFAHFKDSTATTGIRCRIFATTNRAATGSFRLGVASGTNTATGLLPNDCKPGTRYRLVCRLTLSNSLSTLWLNPNSERDPGVSSTDEAAVKAVIAFAFRQSLSSGSGMGELSVDDLVVATTFTDALLKVAPSIRTAPKAQSAPTGSEVIFTVEASGAPPLSYQWLFNGLELSGATQPTLVLPSVSEENGGEYQVVVSNSEGSTSSDPVLLSVQPVLPAVLIVSDPLNGIRLSWTAEPDRTYSVWAGEAPEIPFALVTGELFFGDGTGWFEETWCGAVARFYRVCSP